MKLFDSHCHIHDPEFVKKYDKTVDQIIIDGQKEGVEQYVCVGTDAKSSLEAEKFSKTKENAYFSIALHPHEVATATDQELDSEMAKLEVIAGRKSSKLVAVGECGLDYFYHNSTEVRNRQKRLFIQHLELAKKHDLPLIFHIREAFDDFFSILDDFGPVSGVVHSFTSNSQHLSQIVERGLYVGLNGIITFSKIESQITAAKNVPKDRLLLETDAPFLTPNPFRGTMCELKHIKVTAEFLANLRNESLEELSEYTTLNARKLFNL